MSQDNIRFESSLPSVAMEVVMQEAKCAGMSPEDFVAYATYSTAMQMREQRERTLSFSQADWERIYYFLGHPELFEGVLERAKEATRHVGKIQESPRDRIG